MLESASRPASRQGRARRLRGVAAALALLASCACTSLSSRRPNVLLISIDSLRADHVGAYGYTRSTTPTIDRLAAEGIRFAWAFSPSSWTLPAHATLLTALPPEEHGVARDFVALRQNVTTVAELFHASGYATAAFVGGSYLMRYYGLSQGFDHYDDFTVATDGASSVTEVTSPALIGAASRWLDAHGRTAPATPFFVFLHLWDVHYDYVPPRPYDTLFDPDYAGSVDGRGFTENARIRPGMAERDLRHVIALYDGEIRFTDHHLGLFLDELAKRALLDDTIVVVTADHGDEFFEHGGKGHRRTLYDESIRVPLVVRYPRRVPAGRVESRPVRLADVAPTLLSLARVSDPGRLGCASPAADGCARDLAAVTTGEDGDAARALAVYGDLHGQQASLRTDSHKLILRVDRMGDPEIYDLHRDPGESRNLAAEQPALRDALLQRMFSWRLAWKDRAKHAVPFEPRPAHLEQLRALGYLQ